MCVVSLLNPQTKCINANLALTLSIWKEHQVLQEVEARLTDEAGVPPQGLTVLSTKHGSVVLTLEARVPWYEGAVQAVDGLVGAELAGVAVLAAVTGRNMEEVDQKEAVANEEEVCLAVRLVVCLAVRLVVCLAVRLMAHFG